MAWGNQGISHYEFGAGNWSQYYWSNSNNPGASTSLCMANCTTYAYGRVMENGLPRPVTQFRNANNWHLYVNTSGNWTLLNYSSGMALLPGDIVEWQANHVAVVETSGTNPYVSASWYTDASIRNTGTLSTISSWMVSNVPNRFYHYVPLTTENTNAGNGLYPVYVIRHSGGGGGGDTPQVTVSPSSYTSTMSSTDSYIDFNFTITVSGIPEDEDARDAISFSTNCHRYMYTTGWVYTSYTSGGVTYQRAVRSLIVRYDRLHDYAYNDTAYMYYRKTFSNGSVNSSTKMNITIQAAPSDPDIEIINMFKRKKRRLFNLRRY